MAVLEKRDNWFTDYQEMPGRNGKRKLDDRVAGFDVRDFAGKTVLDLGCNIGQMSLYAASCGAERVLGVEYDKAAFIEAMAIRNHVGVKTVRYTRDDLDSPLFWHKIEPHDTVLLLSVIDTKELTNRFGVLSRSCMKCKQTFYLEGHGGQPYSKYIRYILDNTDFTQIEHVGHNEGRDLFRCSRNVLDTDGFHQQIIEACKRYNRIGVIGNRRAGKTTLCKSVVMPGFTILDDCNRLRLIDSSEKLLLFDYRAALYAEDLDVIFSVLQPPEEWESFRKLSLPSPELFPSGTLSCFYTVRTR